MGFGRNLLMSLFPTVIPEKEMTDDEVIRRVGGFVPKGVNAPVSVLRDALRGAEIKASTNEDYSVNDLIGKALATRLEQQNVPMRGMAYSPTGADMFDLWNPDIVVPEKSKLPNFWE